jgi:hypothetical protein
MCKLLLLGNIIETRLILKFLLSWKLPAKVLTTRLLREAVIPKAVNSLSL